MNRFLSIIFAIAGVALLLVAFVSLTAAIFSYLERSKYGSGLFFADVEIFAFSTIFFGVLGGFLLLIRKKLFNV